MSLFEFDAMPQVCNFTESSCRLLPFHFADVSVLMPGHQLEFTPTGNPRSMYYPCTLDKCAGLKNGSIKKTI